MCTQANSGSVYITVNNFKVGSNYVECEDNVSNGFHGGLCDLKYVPRKVQHACHKDCEKHERCLVQCYNECLDVIKVEMDNVDAFYFGLRQKTLLV